MPINVLDALSRRRPEFVLVDAAQDREVLGFLISTNATAVSLFDGESALKLGAYAPYLVTIPPGDVWLAQLIEKGWGKAWFVFLCSPSSAQDVRSHLRSLLYVKDSAGETLYFRFYDPRILRIFLPALAPDSLGEFFGPVSQFILEADDPSEILLLAKDDRGLQISSRANST